MLPNAIEPLAQVVVTEADHLEASCTFGSHTTMAVAFADPPDSSFTAV
jgi:hypothetical protein